MSLVRRAVAVAVIALVPQVGAATSFPDPSMGSTLTRNSDQVRYCYETRLKANSGLSGRVEVTWNISGGRVTAAELFANTTGDGELADCIIGKVKRWTGFPPEAEGEVQWPFIFKQKS